jgi:hypothetical protein
MATTLSGGMRFFVWLGLFGSANKSLVNCLSPSFRKRLSLAFFDVRLFPSCV